MSSPGIGPVLGFLAIVFGLGYLDKLSKKKKNAKNENDGAFRTDAKPASTREPLPTQNRMSSESKRTVSVFPEGEDPCHERELYGPDLRPTLFGVNREEYRGSLNISTEEGIDICHEEQADQMTALEVEELPSDEGAGGMRFNWEGNEVMKAFVMQEILRRPCERTVK